MSSRSNLDVLYNDLLPEVFRREDEPDRFLQRLLTAFCETMDSIDAKRATFHEEIAPETASDQFIAWWLQQIFGWSYFPEWFTLPQRRAFYKDIATHYAERGTARGIEHFLAAFGIDARVITSGQYCDDAVFGSDEWSVSGPLAMIVQILSRASTAKADYSYCLESFVEDAIATEDENPVSKDVDIDTLLGFHAAIGQTIWVENKQLL